MARIPDADTMDHPKAEPGRIAAARVHERRRRTRRPAPTTRVSAASAGLPRRFAARKSPRQDRSRATVEAILGAAVDLFSSRGYARSSTNQIAARAGVSVGSLYQYFPNKDAILAALFERHARGIERVVETAFAELQRPDVPMREAIRRMLVGFETFHDADPKMARAVDPHAAGAQQPAQIVRRQEERFRSALAGILLHRPDVRRGNRSIMASLLFDIVEAVTRSLMHGDARRFDRREALDEAIEAICRYVDG